MMNKVKNIIFIILSLYSTLLFAGFRDDNTKLNIILFKAGYPAKIPQLVIWKDGVFLMWPLSGKRENFALIGKYDKKDLNKALKNIENTGFFQLDGKSNIVIDSSYKTIYVAFKSQQRLAFWHEYLNPGFGGDITTDSKYRKFVKVWNAVKAEIIKLTPVEIHRAREVNELKNKKAFRGINLLSPSKSVWPFEKKPRSNTTTD